MDRIDPLHGYSRDIVQIEPAVPVVITGRVLSCMLGQKGGVVFIYAGHPSPIAPKAGQNIIKAFFPLLPGQKIRIKIGG